MIANVSWYITKTVSGMDPVERAARHAGEERLAEAADDRVRAGLLAGANTSE